MSSIRYGSDLLPIAFCIILLVATTTTVMAMTLTPTSAPTVSEASPPPSPTMLWRIRLQKSDNTTFGVPVLSNGLLAVYAIDVPARSTLLCVFDITTASKPNMLWSRTVAFVEEASGWIAAGWNGQQQSGDLAFYAGSMTSITAYNAKTGNVMWVRTFPVAQLVSAHPTYYDGLVYVAYENGVLSAPVVVLNATNGNTVWQTNDAAFTLIWPIYSDILQRPLVVYCGIDTAHAPPNETGIVLYARDAYSGEVIWTINNMTTTELNNNPNLVVGYGPKGVYMYSKPIHNLRIITLMETATGRVLWSLPATGDIDDYDTFTWNRNFFRLVSVNQTTFSVQAIDELMNVRWTSYFESIDLNVNILVGGLAVITVGLQANQITSFDANNGRLIWQLNVPRPNDGNVDDHTKVSDSS
jgi:outer membrane protein assembly factor BamB